MDANLKIFKALSDRTRLAILRALMEKEYHVEELAENMGVTPSTVSFHLKKLAEAGFIESKKDQYYNVFRLKPDMVARTLGDIIAESHGAPRPEDLYRKKVEKAFFKYGKLIQIPVGRKKRRIVLDIIAAAFEKDRKYSEKEVNLIIADFHEDFCTLRREMIDEKIMDRENGIYWLLGDDK